MSEPKITLFDISSFCKPQAWSPNTWKARLVLNYKQIPYKTVWVSFPDIEDTLKNIGGKPTGFKPNKGGNAPLYTLPAILDESGDTPVVIADSLAIAEYLDAKYPERLYCQRREELSSKLLSNFSRLFRTSPLVD
ncbi:hypothetical protein BU17DRAFT_93208 [Hysterangium stoloniferum]|nr:hypothetical protein BU17DRAFT_93208 [Hysterangium stoloniferum]